MGSHIANPYLTHLDHHSDDETPFPLGLLHSRCYLHLAISSFYSEILGHAFHIWMPYDYAVIFSHGSKFSISCSHRSHLHAGGVCNGLTLATTFVQLRRSPMSNTELKNPHDNRARSMANISQAPDLESIHYEMHGIAEQIRITNELNARLATKTHRIAIVLVKDIHLEAISIDRQVCTPSKEEALVCWSLGHLAELMIQWTRKLGAREDHLAGTIELTGVKISPLPKKLKT
ncbi:hypothetical protein Acr_26g0000590 [Actinidia rufa]|uniref:Uncharacterized protein n=1 Tax=Actinidia rufa TaxID=165716 RepID=A0A7J0H124_9ERIC|nr:hypothetical protein Acr_26g0000590 [Actinidia rufa]